MGLPRLHRRLWTLPQLHLRRPQRTLPRRSRRRRVKISITAPGLPCRLCSCLQWWPTLGSDASGGNVWHRAGAPQWHRTLQYRITMEGMVELSVAVGDLQVLILCSATLSSYVWRFRVSRAQAPGEEALSPVDRRIKQVEV